MSKQLSPTLHNMLSNYIEFINKSVIEQHGKSYMTPENTRNKWRVEIAYSITVEKFLLTQTKLFINMLDSRDKNTTNPMFLKSLVNEISDYLSKYIMRGKNTNRNGATKEIKEILWNETRHIQYVLTKQQARQDAADKKKFAKQQNKQKKVAKANFDYNIAKGVQSEFIYQQPHRLK